MSSFKIENQNVSVEYFGISNALKLSVSSPDSDEYGNTYYYTESMWIDPHNKDLDTIINALQEAKKLL